MRLIVEKKRQPIEKETYKQPFIRAGIDESVITYKKRKQARYMKVFRGFMQFGYDCERRKGIAKFHFGKTIEDLGFKEKLEFAKLFNDRIVKGKPIAVDRRIHNEKLPQYIPNLYVCNKEVTQQFDGFFGFKEGIRKMLRNLKDINPKCRKVLREDKAYIEYLTIVLTIYYLEKNGVEIIDNPIGLTFKEDLDRLVKRITF